MEQWFDGVQLLGRFGKLRTGCWLLQNGTEAAVLEFPPYLGLEGSPAEAAVNAVRETGASVKYLLCTHSHGDHFCQESFAQMRYSFPEAQVVLQSGFRQMVNQARNVEWFDGEASLTLGGEPLFLVHAPKHSATDTHVIFRGSICTGDWELNTIRTVNEQVPVGQRIESIEKMIAFVKDHDYCIHRSYSVHANDRREGIDFTRLMEETLLDRKMW